jgi:hypothetical protein
MDPAVLNVLDIGAILLHRDVLAWQAQVWEQDAPNGKWLQNALPTPLSTEIDPGLFRMTLIHILPVTNTKHAA